MSNIENSISSSDSSINNVLLNSPKNNKKNNKLLSKFQFQNLDLILAYFLDSQKKILPRRLTGLKSGSQKKLKKSVKNVRKLGLIPFSSPLRY